MTTIAGANSSGKSSLLQSLLLVAQSVSADQFVLNGPLVSLGNAVDVLRTGESELTLGGSFRVRRSAVTRSSDAASLASIELRLTYLRKRESLTPIALDLTVDDEPFLEAEYSKAGPSVDPTGAQQRVEEETISTLRVTRLRGKAKRGMYVQFGGFLPLSFITKQRVTAARKQLSWLTRDQLLGDPRAQQALRRLVQQMARSFPEFDDRWQVVLSSGLNPGLMGTDKSRAGLERTDIEALREDLAALMVWSVEPLRGRVARLSIERWRALLDEPEVLDEQIAEVIHYLTGGVEAISDIGRSLAYLGPLREAPQIVSALGEGSRNLPVGARGEFTADFLARRRNAAIRYSSPDGNRREAPLAAAVSEWVRYLGVGESVRVLDQGKLGRSLRIAVNGAERDLTAVGVGASQVLPVVTLVLGVPPSSLVLLEQPELHLHPAVQARLADFFIKARPDLRLIVETHSETLVSRMRRRVAEGDLTPETLSIVFVGQEDGISKFSELTVGAYGDLSEWPEGFFDTADADSQAIVAAVTRRRSDSAEEAEV